VSVRKYKLWGQSYFRWQ